MALKREVTPAMTAFVRRGDRLALDVRCVTFMGGVLLTEIREIEIAIRNLAYTL
jgi:hypothetical protein